MVENRRAKSSEGNKIQPLLLTIPQVMGCLALGRNKVYDLINKEGLPVRRFGRAVRVSYADLQQWLDRRDSGSIA